jgi:DNA end-binding protein Ku
MPRSLWTGALSFGLVNVPVQVLSAVRDLDLHFHQLHEPDGVPLETRRVCSQDGEEVPYEDIARSFEWEDGTSVVVSDEELDALEPRRTKTIDIEQFVDLADVDPVSFDHPYFLAPAADNDGALRAYRLLAEVMGRTERAALGRFVMRTKEYLALIRVRDGVLTLTTMLFHDEVRPAGDVPHGTSAAKPSKGELEGAVGLIEALSVPWDPARYEDRYQARLRDLVERKRRGQTIKAVKEVDEPSPVPDLMAALKESLRAARERGGQDGDRDGGAAGDGDRSGLEDLTRDELYGRAQDAGIPGRSSMSKDELVDALS